MAEMNALAAAAHARADRVRSTWPRCARHGCRRCSAPATTGRRSSARRSRRWPIRSWSRPERADSSIRSRSTSTCVGLLWFERPFDLAHEWSHDAAYAREDEANYLAIVTCLRSPDPVVRYSGWFELFLYLPQKRHYARREFVPLVWQDFAALRKRNARHINVHAGALDVAHV